MNSVGRVVTLLEMLKFYAYAFVKIANTISQLRGAVSIAHLTKVGEVLHQGNLPPEMVQFKICMLRELRQDCANSLLDSATDQIDRMLVALESYPISWDESIRMEAEFVNRFEDELKRRTFYQLRPEVVDLFEAVAPFGDDVEHRFTDALWDIREACKCFACERYDAMVFHLNRATEVVLRNLAKQIEIDYAPNWDSYLKKIDDFLRTADRKTPEQRGKITFLSGTSVLLRAVKEAWRNPDMHIASKYSSDQARDILRSVKAFMICIAKEGRI
jgi:hypothetical protein